MSSDPIVLSPERARQLQAASERAENLPPRREQQPQRRPLPAPPPHNCVQPTSSVAQSITVAGGTVKGVPAVWCYFDTGTASWTVTSNVCWLMGANKEAFKSGHRYQARIVGADTSGVPIWVADYSSCAYFTVTGDWTTQSVTITATGAITNLSVYSGTVSDASPAAPTSAAYVVVAGDFIPTFNVPYVVWPYGQVTISGTTYPVYYLDYHAPVTELTGGGGVVVGDNSNNGLTLNSNSITFGPGAQGSGTVPRFPANTNLFTALSIIYGATYACATATDGVGNMFVGGLNVNVGGPPPLPAIIDGGSYW